MIFARRFRDCLYLSSMFVQQDQIYFITIILENTCFQNIQWLPYIKKYYFRVLHKNVIEFGQYSASKNQCRVISNKIMYAIVICYLGI